MKQLNARIAAVVVGGLMVLSMFGIGANAQSQAPATAAAGTSAADSLQQQQGSQNRTPDRAGRTTAGGRTFSR